MTPDEQAALARRVTARRLELPMPIKAFIIGIAVEIAAALVMLGIWEVVKWMK